MLEVLGHLDQLETYHREIIARDHPLIDRRRGQVVTDPATGKVVLDPRPARIAEKELIEIRKLRDSLIGVDWGDDPDQQPADSS